ncbi:Hypothetical protein CINCED_3A000319 [Cinara cedri]|uniref:Uncharacterized protein n=1 Tax=Cinara cedri TaxID=506608 RepID=A0A5E4MXB0_9HEMI|nr:Hypothetical protein CINCED_3A000319 [Cinara cedri]
MFKIFEKNQSISPSVSNLNKKPRAQNSNTNSNDGNICPGMKSKKAELKKVPKSCEFKFDMKSILKERQAESKYWEKNAKIDEEMKIVDELFQKEIEQNVDIDITPAIPTLGYVIFDHSKYNNFIKINSNFEINSWSQRLLAMSIEENEFVAHTHFLHLMKADWLPGIDDIKNILLNWGTDFDTLTNKPLLKCQIINKHGLINHHNFALVFQFFSLSVLKSNNVFSNDDLLTIAKFVVIISLDYYCGQMLNPIKTLFSICVEKGLHEDNDTGIIAFAEEMISRHNEEIVLKMVVDLFLPIEGHVMKKMYCYLTFKFFKSFLKQTKNKNPFPTSINDWFVQDLVDKKYFKKNPETLSYVIELLEHVVFILDLYKDEEKLSDMYDFLYCLAKSTKLLDSHKLINILDQWRLRLFRLHATRKSILF